MIELSHIIEATGEEHDQDIVNYGLFYADGWNCYGGNNYFSGRCY